MSSELEHNHQLTASKRVLKTAEKEEAHACELNLRLIYVWFNDFVTAKKNWIVVIGFVDTRPTRSLS